MTVTAKPNAGADQTVSCFTIGEATMAASGTGTWTLDGGSAGSAMITTPTSPTTKVTSFSVSGTYIMIWTSSACRDTALITVNSDCACPVTNNSLTGPVSPVCSPFSGLTIDGEASMPTGGNYLWQVNTGSGFSNASGINNIKDYSTCSLFAGNKY